MKSAFELAMERLGEPVKKYTAEQKEQLAEIDRLYDSRVVQAKFGADDRRRKAAADAEALRQIAEDLALEVRSLDAKRERRKEECRASFKTDSKTP